MSPRILNKLINQQLRRKDSRERHVVFCAGGSTGPEFGEQDGYRAWIEYAAALKSFR